MLFRSQLVSLQGVGKLGKLDELNVSSNQLESLDGIQNMEKLRSLYVSDNRLKGLNEVTTIKNLEWLKVDYNRITELPNLMILPKLRFVRFGFNFINSTSDEVATKLPVSKYDAVFMEDMEHQNIEYAIEFTEPASLEQVNANTGRISGRIHMPAEKIQITINENLNDDDDFITYLYADVGEDGSFVFENLDLKKYAGRKADFRIGICYEYDTEHGFYHDSALRRYPIK